MRVAQTNVQKRLREELDKVNREVVELKKAGRPQELEGLGDNTPLSEDVDAIQSTALKEDDARRLAHLLARAAALDEALRRAEERVYGQCVDCDKDIAPKRLESVPEAARCIGCQERHERATPPEFRTARWSEAMDLYEKRAAFEGEGFARRPQSLEESEGLSLREQGEVEQKD